MSGQGAAPTSSLVAADWVVIVLYLGFIVCLGVLAGRSRKLKSAADFFLGGRDLKWWLVGTSMVATTVAADTPLAIAGITINNGVAGNWFWWSMLLSNVLVSLVLARLWARADVVTDAEFCELRYGGRTAAALRGIKAFYFAVPINCIVMGWVFLAMIKISAALLPELETWQVIGGLLVLTLVYSIRSGFSAVVLTDLVQFPIAFIGALILAIFAIDAAGGLDAVVEHVREVKGETALELFPAGSEHLPWHAVVAFLGVQWWAQKSADGGGIFIQRLLAARSERDAERGGIWFCVANYVVRPWPWILTGLAAVVLLPELAGDPATAESTYPQLIVEVLPAGLRGFLVAAFLAAFMSTIDTHINWGASYLVNDLAARFGTLSPTRVTLISRLSVLGMAGLALVATAAMETIEDAWMFIVAFGAGAGAVILLRWYWWRITAASEIAAMGASTVLAVIVYLAAPIEWVTLDGTEVLVPVEAWTYLDKLAVIVPGSAAVWIPVTLATAPKPDALVAFYRKVRPAGPGWRRVAQAAGEGPPESLWVDVARWLLGLVSVGASLLGLGHALLESMAEGLLIAAVGMVGVAVLVGWSPARSSKG